MAVVVQWLVIVTTVRMRNKKVFNVMRIYLFSFSVVTKESKVNNVKSGFGGLTGASATFVVC